MVLGRHDEQSGNGLESDAIMLYKIFRMVIPHPLVQVAIDAKRPIFAVATEGAHAVFTNHFDPLFQFVFEFVILF